MKYLFFIVFIIHALTAFSQKGFIEGKITDKQSGIPVTGANVTFTGTRIGCISDAKGKFRIEIDTLPVNIIVSHVGYKTYRKWIRTANLNLSIELEPSSTQLPEVEISDKSIPQIFYTDNKYSVLDYEADNNLVYLLIYKSRLAKSMIICLSLSGDTIAKSGLLNFKPQKLFPDCLGFMHVLSKDSAYQLAFDNNILRLSYGYSIDRFNITLGNCVASTPDYLFFRFHSFTKLTVNFYSVGRSTHKLNYIASSADKQKINLLRKNGEDMITLMTNEIPDGKDTFVEWCFVKKILYKPNNSFMRQVGDSLLLFNSTEGIIEFYDLEGNIKDSLKLNISEMINGRWRHEFFIDEMTRKIYTSFEKNGIISIFRINLITGSLKHILTVTHPFPQKIEICNDNLFYMYDLPALDDNRFLYRQRLR